MDKIIVSLFDGSRMAFPAGDRVATFLLEGWFESAEQAFVRQVLKAGDVFLDVGAHAGLYSVLARQAVGPGGRIIAVEPNDAIMPFLESNLSAAAVDDPAILPDKGTAILKAALSSESGEAEFFAGRDGFAAYSSLRRNDETGDAATIRKFALDDILKSARLDRIDFIKADIEGAEMLFLEGARKTLARLPDIILMMEFSNDAQSRFEGSSEALGQALERLNLATFDVNIEQQSVREIASTENLWHRNLVIARDRSLIERRLAGAPPEIRTACIEEARRGVYAHALYERALAGEKLVSDIREWTPTFVDIERMLAGAADTGLVDAAKKADAAALKPLLHDASGRIRSTAEFVARSLAEARAERAELIAATDELNAIRNVLEGKAIDDGDFRKEVRAAAYGGDNAPAIGKRHIDAVRDEIGRAVGAARYTVDHARKTAANLEATSGALAASLDEARKLRRDIDLRAALERELRRDIDLRAALERELRADIDRRAALERELHDDIAMLAELEEALRAEVETLGEEVGELSKLPALLAASRQEFNRMGDLALALHRSRIISLARSVNSPLARIADQMVALYTAETPPQ